MLQDFISCFNGKWAYFTMFVFSNSSTENVQPMLSLCVTLCVHIFPFSFIITGTRPVCEFHIYCITVITFCKLHVLFFAFVIIIIIVINTTRSGWEDEDYLKNWWGKLSEDIHLEDVDEDGRVKIILEVKETGFECSNWAEVTKYRVQC